MIQCVCFSEDVERDGMLPFFLSWMHGHSVGEYELGLFWLRGSKSYRTSSEKASVTTDARERNITVVNGVGWGHVVTTQPPNSHLNMHTPTNSPHFPSAGVTFAWTYLLIVKPDPSGERVSKHVPLPHGAAVNRGLKDEWQKRRGSKRVRKVKKSSVKFWKSWHWNKENKQSVFVFSATDTSETTLHSCRQGNGKIAWIKTCKYSNSFLALESVKYPFFRGGRPMGD